MFVFGALMKKFFDNVDNNKQVNFKLYIEKFKEKGIAIEKMFVPVLVANPYYILTPKNIDDYNTLKLKMNVHIEKTDRTSYAVHGDSHLTSVSYAFLLVKESINDTIKTVFFDKGKIEQTELVAMKKKAIIIENLENFGNTLANFRNINIDLTEYSFIFGSGNSITNPMFNDFLMSFDELLCLFDIDAGGLQMFNTLDKRYPQCQFIYPDNLLWIMDKYVANSHGKEVVLALNSKFGYNKKLHPILTLINKTQKTVEQELYLIEDTNDE